MNIKYIIENKIKKNKNRQKAKMTMKFTKGALAGIVAGVVGGILGAPKSGKETRGDIAKTAKNIGESAVTKTVEVKEILDNKLVDTKNNATMVKEKIIKHLPNQKSKISNGRNEVISQNVDIESIFKIKE